MQDALIKGNVNNAGKNYRYDIAMLRLLCIVIVVFFHAYGMTYVHFSEATNALYCEKYEMFNSTYLINIAMPMFIFISGFLFGGQLLRRRPVSFAKMVKSKFIRLMIPFFAFTILFMFTQNAVSFKPFYQWTYSHLWFLPMLFWCFIITYFLQPLILNNNYILTTTTLLLLFSLSLLGKLIPPFLGLHGVSVWLCWFVLGVWFYKHEHILILSDTSSLLKFVICLGGVIIFIIAMTIKPQEYGSQTVLGIIVTISCIYSLWILFHWIPWQNMAVTDFLLSLSSCSFGIYIFHNWLEAHMISSTAQRVLRLEELASNHIYLYPFMFSTVVFILSLGLTWILLKFKIGQKLIG